MLRIFDALGLEVETSKKIPCQFLVRYFRVRICRALLMPDLTLEQLFEAYKSCYANPRMTQEQAEHLQSWHVKRGRTGIILSRVDFWLLHAGLIKKNFLVHGHRNGFLQVSVSFLVRPEG